LRELFLRLGGGLPGDLVETLLDLLDLHAGGLGIRGRIRPGQTRRTTCLRILADGLLEARLEVAQLLLLLRHRGRGDQRELTRRDVVVGEESGGGEDPGEHEAPGPVVVSCSGKRDRFPGRRITGYATGAYSWTTVVPSRLPAPRTAIPISSRSTTAARIPIAIHTGLTTHVWLSVFTVTSTSFFSGAGWTGGGWSCRRPRTGMVSVTACAEAPERPCVSGTPARGADATARLSAAVSAKIMNISRVFMAYSLLASHL